MIREKLILNDNVFIADYYNSLDDIGNNIETKFVFIRNYDIINGIANDKDIYIIEKSIYIEAIQNIIKSKNKLDNTIIYPILNNNSLYYTNNYELFNGLFIDNSLYKNIENDDTNIENYIGDDIYLFYDNNGNEKNIKCNLIKLYKPNGIDINNCIIHVSNYINGINFHYLCRLYDKYETLSDTLFTIDNNTYCEYITILIPSLDSLFDGTTYFNENLNNIVSEENNNFINNITIENNGTDLIDFSILLYPYEIEKYKDNGVETDILCKKYFKQINNNNLLDEVNIHPIKISLYLYSSINETTYLYVSNIMNHSGLATFISDTHVELINDIGFNEESGKISLITKIHYNNINIDDEDTFDTYCKYYNINPQEYENYNVKILDNIRKDFCEEYNYDYNDLLDTSTKAYRMFESFIYENEENINSRINFIGYNLILTSDINGKNVLYDYYFPINFNEDYKQTIMKRYLSIFNVFEKWSELPNTLYASIIFIDRYIGNVIKGNKVCITKEWFKYIISDTDIHKLSTIIDKSKDMTEIKFNETSDSTQIPLFINKINCIIKKDSKEASGYKNSNTPRVLYKPYFYKVQDLQNIYLRSGLIQNIGINLNEYMTKVETFKLSIENLMYIEIGRNDAYVIFRINAVELANTGGRYDIFNQDDEYISSGQYTLY